MGVVARQTIKNIFSTYLGFIVGGINTLFLYTYYLSEAYFGLVGFLLSTATILSPVIAFGSNLIILRYFSTLNEQEKRLFIPWMLIIPLLLSLFVGILGLLFFEQIVYFLSSENPLIGDYIWPILFIAVAIAYFEVFYAFARIHYKSVFGNFIKETFHRLGVLCLLLAVSFSWITEHEFIWAMVVVYLVRMLVMFWYSLTWIKPIGKISFAFIKKQQLLGYAFFMIVSGLVGLGLLDIDRFMLGKLIPLEQIAYYNVSIFVATIIFVPVRSMMQITNPLVAEYINRNQLSKLEALYQNTTFNLLLIAGALYLLILAFNPVLYAILPDNFRYGLTALYVIGGVKFIENMLGINTAILTLSEFYKKFIILSLLILGLAVVLNAYLIPVYGINGAAWATFLTYVVYGFLRFFLVWKYLNIKAFKSGSLVILIVVLAVAVLFYFVPFSKLIYLEVLFKSLFVLFLGVLFIRIFRFDREIRSFFQGLRATKS